MKKILISSLILGTMLVPSFGVHAQVTADPTTISTATDVDSLKSTLITLLTQLIAQLQDQINTLLAQQATQQTQINNVIASPVVAQPVAQPVQTGGASTGTVTPVDNLTLYSYNPEAPDAWNTPVKTDVCYTPVDDAGHTITPRSFALGTVYYYSTSTKPIRITNMHYTFKSDITNNPAGGISQGLGRSSAGPNQDAYTLDFTVAPIGRNSNPPDVANSQFQLNLTGNLTDPSNTNNHLPYPDGTAQIVITDMTGDNVNISGLPLTLPVVHVHNCN